MFSYGERELGREFLEVEIQGLEVPQVRRWIVLYQNHWSSLEDLMCKTFLVEEGMPHLSQSRERSTLGVRSQAGVLVTV
jgi:hypothetical protein